MKQIKFFLAGTLFLGSMLWDAYSAHSQDCRAIWTKCIDSIYQQNLNVLAYTLTEPIDPTVGFDTSNRTVEYLPFTFYIDKNIRELTSNQFSVWLKDELGVKEIGNMGFSKIVGTDSLIINSSKLNFCHKMYNSDKYKVNVKKIESCTGSDVGYTTAKSISLSSILVSDNGKYAILYAVTRHYSDDFCYAILLKKDKQHWNIVKMTKSFYR